MQVFETDIPDVKRIVPRRFEDDRGYFSETYNQRAWDDAGLTLRFVQDNHSLSKFVGTIRGLHFQRPPFAQDKLVRVVRGRVRDVAVDLRQSSPTFGQHITCDLSAENGFQLLVPAGFAHGFCTLEPDTEVIYKVTAPYSREHDDGMSWNDPALSIDWGVSPETVVLSEKDKGLPTLADLDNPF